MQHNEKFLALTSNAKTQIEETDVQTVKSMLDNKETFVLIDVREESEWANGHLPGAIHLSKGVIERDIEKHVPDANAKIVLYCGGGLRSALAANNLQKMGYKKVISMDGGFGGWVKAGFAVV